MGNDEKEKVIGGRVRLRDRERRRNWSTRRDVEEEKGIGGGS